MKKFMQKKWKRLGALLLVCVMLFGCLDVLPETTFGAVSGSYKTVTCAGSDFDFVYRYWEDISVSDGLLTFDGDYYEYITDLSKTIDLSQAKSMTVKVSGQGGKLAFKLYTSDDTEITTFWDNSGSSEYTFDLTEVTGSLGIIGIMSQEGDNTPYTVQIESISFNTTQNISYFGRNTSTGSSSSSSSSNAATYYTYTGAGSHFYFEYTYWSDVNSSNGLLTFEDNYYEYVTELAETIDLSKAKSLKIYVADQGGKFAVKLYGKNETEIATFWDNSGASSYTFDLSELSGTLTKIGIMSQEGDSTPFTVQIKSIALVSSQSISSFQSVGSTASSSSSSTTGSTASSTSSSTSSSGSYSTVTCAGSDFVFAYRYWEDNSSSNGLLTFDGDYYEYLADLSQSLDLSQARSMTVKVSGQGGKIAVKLYAADDTEITTFWDNTGATSYTFDLSDISDTLVKIGIMSQEGDSTPYTVQIESISFDTTQNISYFGSSSTGSTGSTSASTGSSGVNTTGYTEINSAGSDFDFVYRYWEEIVVSDGLLTFDSDYYEYLAYLSESVDLSQAAAITINVSGQGGKFAFKLYAENDEEITTFWDNTGSTSYTFDLSEFSDTLVKIGIMSQEGDTVPFTMQVDSISLWTTQSIGSFGSSASGSTESGSEDDKDIEYGVNLIQNPNFEDADNLDVWGENLWDPAVITSETSDTEISDSGVTTYGKLSGRDSNYVAFAQDITDIIEKGETYEISFYIMLDADDYANSTDTQRTVDFSPYITAGGTTEYGVGLGDGASNVVLEAGEWTKITCTYTPDWSGTLEQAVIRMLNQGSDYGAGDGLMGTYYVTAVSMIKVESDSSVSIQEDITDWKDAVTEALGDDVVAGTAVTTDEWADEGVQALVEKHFNAITIGNELKPDYIFGYSDTCPGTETVTLNGETFEFPVMNFSGAEEICDAILEWNEANPDDQIKIRGHVLVWHSQTPEWFFHVDYDESKDYVTAEEMSLRMEYYIKTVLEHFTAEDSKYAGLFYAWDVVNEAVSDSTGTYRTDSEDSSWWAVYGSNEFIIEAFRYANKYAPEDLDLYYNDYGETGSRKRNGIIQLLKDVSEAEGTRITGIGMQAHYQTDTFSITDFEASIRAYAAIVDKVMLTELDFTSSEDYEDTEIGRMEELLQMAYCHQAIFEKLQELNEEDGITISGINVWGVIETDSWLYSQHPERAQCPLLFDGNYQAKPSYWAYVDATKLDDYAAEILALTSTEVVTEEEGTEAVEETTENNDDAEETEKNSNWVIWVVVAAVVVVAGGAGIAAYLTMRKRKKQ